MAEDLERLSTLDALLLGNRNVLDDGRAHVADRVLDVELVEAPQRLHDLVASLLRSLLLAVFVDRQRVAVVGRLLLLLHVLRRLLEVHCDAHERDRLLDEVHLLVCRVQQADDAEERARAEVLLGLLQVDVAERIQQLSAERLVYESLGLLARLLCKAARTQRLVALQALLEVLRQVVEALTLLLGALHLVELLHLRHHGEVANVLVELAATEHHLEELAWVHEAAVGLRAALAVLIVALAHLGIREHLVGLADLHSLTDAVSHSSSARIVPRRSREHIARTFLNKASASALPGFLSGWCLRASL